MTESTEVVTETRGRARLSELFSGETRLRRLFREHPALILTSAYFILTFIGFVYTVALFVNFRINVAYYAEAGDFLLAAFREPLVIVLSVLPVFLWEIYVGSAEWVQRKIPRYDAWAKKHEASYARKGDYRKLGLTLQLLALCLWILAFIMHYSNRVADQIREGKRKAVKVFVVSAPQTPRERILIGTTSRFVFLHDPGTHRTEIIPEEQISQIVVQGKKPRAGSS